MIHVYRWSKTGFQVIDTDQPAIPERSDEWIWVDVVGEEPEMVRRIGRRLGVDPSVVEESLSPANLPLVEEHLDDLFVVLHGFATGSGERLSTPEIDIFIGSRFLITVHDDVRTSIEQIKGRLYEEGGVPVTSPAGLLAMISLIAGRRFSPLIQELERQVDSLEEMAIGGDPQTMVEAHALRRDIIFLRRALAPQLEVYEDLAESVHPAIDEEARRLFLRVAHQHQRILEALEAGRALLGSVVDTYRGAVADQTNEIMRVLTVFSAILLPLTLIAGLWGMNFVEIPGDDLELGFWGLLGLMLLLAVGVWIYFTRRGFIGAPRLRELPKSVGLGLVNIGAAPIRAVTGGIRGLGKTDE